MFQRYVASVSYGCCKSRSGCCTCYNGCTCMFQVYVPNVSSVFSDVCLQVFHLDVAYVFANVSIVFIRMLQVFHLDVSKVDLVLQQVFHMHISSFTTTISFLFCSSFFN